MTETKKANLLAWAIFFYLTLTIFYKAFAGIGMLLFIILAFFVSKETYKEIFKNKLNIFLLLFILTMIVANIINGGGNNSKFKYYLIPLIFTGAFYQFGHLITKKWIKRIVFWTLVLSALSSFVGVIQVLFHYNILKFEIDTYPRNQGALMGGAMYYSYPIALICTMTLAGIVHFKKFKDYIDIKVLVITLVINLVGLYFSYTRGAMLGFIAGIPFIFFYTNKKIFTSIVAVGVLLAGFLGYVLFGNSNMNFYRFKANENSTSYRLSLFQTSMKMFKEKPIFGYGVRNFEHECVRVQDQYDIKPRFCDAVHSHNQFLDSLSNAGIVGTIPYVLFFGLWLIIYFTSFNVTYFFALPGYITYLAITMTDTPLYIGPVTSIIFIMYGMLFVKKKG